MRTNRSIAGDNALFATELLDERNPKLQEEWRLRLAPRLSREGERPAEERLIEMLHIPGGYEVLGELLKINPRELTSAGKIDYLAALEKQHSWLTSLIQDATLAIAGNSPSESDELWQGVDESEREDVATALRLSPQTAQLRIDVARTLSNHLPATCQALSTGDLSPAHATLIARESAEAIKRGVSEEALREIELKAIAHSEFHTPAQVGRKIRTLIAQHAPEEFEASNEIARDSRSVSLHHESDGMSTLIALLPAEDAQTVYQAINAMIEWEENSRHFERADSTNEKFDVVENVASTSTNARFSDSANLKARRSEDTRTIDMKRADALSKIAADFLGRISTEYTPHRRPVTINLTMDLPTMLGLAENPALLSGYGPIPASIGRQLAQDGKWRKFITDPESGALLDIGREIYSPPQFLVDFLAARDRICRFPGCSQPARVSDIDHAQPWEEGGATSPKNLGFLCRRHHRLKTHNGWKIESFDDGSCTWISPAGKKFFVPARPVNESV